ncbi:MAG TPA: hypothetical protein VMU54_21405, partial [Planctomycetota bacterium]|nr:hypothetical protein [Planctomycetota bacterium]
MADPAGGKPSILAHTEEIRRGLRRVVFMSKGAAISAAGVFMGWTAGFGSSWTAFPSLRPYIVAAYGAGCGGLVFLSFSLRRRRAQADCRVEMERKATARERLGLWLGIPLGVAGVIVLNLSLPRTLVPTWLGPASLILFLLLAGGYFLHLALEVRLFEL